MSEHINPSSRGVSYTANGNTKEFTCPFIVWAKDGVDVYLDGIKQLSTEYEIEGVGNANGCEITFKETPVDGTIVTFIGNTSRERAVDYNQYVTLTAKSMNLDADYQETQIQENTAALKRTIQMPVHDALNDGGFVLPPAEERKNAYLAFDEEGYPMVLGTAQNIVYGLADKGSTPGGIMIWQDDTGARAGDSGRVFGMPDGAATLGSNGKVPDSQLPNLGHDIALEGTVLPFRRVLDFSREFDVKSGERATYVRSGMKINTLGDGEKVVKDYTGNGTVNVQSLIAGANIGFLEKEDGGLEVMAAASPEKRYVLEFTSDTWDKNLQITIPPELHGLGEQPYLLVWVRDEDGDQALCNIKVSSNGIVRVKTDVRFSGALMIHGMVTLNEALLVNPMRHENDLIIGGPLGKPMRLGIGKSNQALQVNADGTGFGWSTLGEAASKDVNIPGGVPVLNEAGMIKPEMLPLSTMTYKGTFGSLNSTAGGDLPTEGVLNGNIYICDTDDYFSGVVGQEFNLGQWAIYDGEEWTAVPNRVTPLPVGIVLPFCGLDAPDNYMFCNGFVLPKAKYQELYDVIGNLYNTGQEGPDEFSIPNYNGEELFLQGSLMPGVKKEAGLPNIVGTCGADSNANQHLSGAFRWIGGGKGAKGGSWNNSVIELNASLSSAIYGRSNTVQPPSQGVCYIIKYSLF